MYYIEALLKGESYEIENNLYKFYPYINNPQQAVYTNSTLVTLNSTDINSFQAAIDETIFSRINFKAVDIVV